ncbi:MAG TPA: formylglycine-generating enzyme family protein [Gammaproteobacteria bacterium]|nr:formylglycine-generating enzyme family protein [Gammaproteobacteria bacterium]
MRFRFALVAILLGGLLPAQAAEPPPSDIVTLQNGNIYSGWLSGGPLVLETDYGRVRLPWAWLRSLRRGGEADRVATIHGERLRGRLVAMDVELDRVLDPALTLHTGDLQAIDFGPREGAPAVLPDVLVLQGGDTLRAAVAAAGLQAGNGLDAGRLAVLDLAVGYDGLRGQWSRRDGVRGTGPVQLEGVEARLAGDQALTLAPGRIESIGFGLPAAGDPERALLQGRFPGDGKASAGPFRDPLGQGGNGPLMVRLPTGSYRRGDLQGDGDRDEQPVTTVHIAEPFAISVFEVTFDEYAVFCRATGRRMPDDSGWGRGARPAVNVSWEDAVAYTEWLSERTGRRYRLPSEAEWEYAARAGSETRFWWGQEMDGLHANCADCGSPWESERTAPVGRFPANAFGLYDTSGNAWEWVLDCYAPHYEDHPTDGRPLQDDRCGKRVIRGGGWSFPAGEARSASRWRDFPARASDDTGFRVVREEVSPGG